MWFVEDAITPCAIFGAAGLIALLTGLNSRRSKLTTGGLVLLIVAGSAFAFDHYIVTDRERIELLVESLCDDFRHKRPATVEYFSSTVPLLKETVKQGMKLVTIEQGPRLTDYEIKITNQGTRATSHFRANATISVDGVGHVGHQPGRFILTWTREDNAWKIISVQRLHPYQDKEMGLLERDAG